MSTVRPSLTPSYLLDNIIGWRQSNTSEYILQDPVAQHLRLGKIGDFAISPLEPGGSFGGQTRPTGVAIAESGFMLLADPAFNRILYYDNLTAQKVIAANAELPNGKAQPAPSAPLPMVELWQPTPVIESTDPHLLIGKKPNIKQAGPYQLNQPTDVAISPLGEIVIADSGNQRVMIYSWPELRLRKQLNFTNGIPRAIAYDNKKRLYVTDSENSQVYRFNTLWERDVNYKGGQGKLQGPIALAALRNSDAEDEEGNFIFVLDAALQQVILLNEQGDVVDTDMSGVEVFNRTFIQPPLDIHNDQLCYPQLSKPNCEKWLLSGIQVDTLGNLATTGISLLARPRVIRLPRSGVFISEQLDGEIAASQWHRITFQANIPKAGRLSIQTFTSDRSMSDTELDDVKWQSAALFTQADNDKFSEILIQSQKGRYLRIRIQFFGDGYTTPTINRIQVFAQRASSLKYLPPPYRQDTESEYFLDRWLSYFDTVLEEARFMIQDFTRYLDPQGVPAGDYLEWLGSWFDWTFLAQWPTELRREMVTRSMEYFKIRGTLEGLKLMLQWHTGLSGEQPSIIEHYRVRHYSSKQIIPSLAVTNSTQSLFIGEKPFDPPAHQISHWFTVVLPTSVVPDQAAYDTILAIINAQKPAHTGFRVCLFAPGLRIGKQSSIGVDTWLGHYPKASVGQFTLGQAAQLSSLSSPGVRIDQSVLEK